MSKLPLNYFMKYQVCITYEKSTIDDKRISGHLYEALDYYFFLKDRGYNACVLIQDNLTDEIILDVITDKYLDKYSKDKYLKNILIQEIQIVACKNIIHCSGLSPTDGTQYIGNIISFRCSLPTSSVKCKYLQDSRIYDSIGIDSDNYIKKLYLDAYKKSTRSPNKILIYANTTLRSDYPVLDLNNQFIVGTSSWMNRPPVMDLFNQFSTYLYTKTKYTSDCSNRLLVECKYHDKLVKFSEEITPEYLQKDTGLRVRLLDLNSDDWLKKLSLSKEDPILKYIK